MNEATADERLELTKVRFRLDGLMHSVQRITVKAQETVEAAMRAVQKAMAHMPSRDPDRGPEDFDTFADERRFYQRLLREQRLNGHGSVNGNGSRQWLRDIVIAVALGLSAWALKTVVDQGKEISRMQCQLSPATCVQVVPRAQ